MSSESIGTKVMINTEFASTYQVFEMVKSGQLPKQDQRTPVLQSAEEELNLVKEQARAAQSQFETLLLEQDRYKDEVAQLQDRISQPELSTAEVTPKQDQIDELTREIARLKNEEVDPKQKRIQELTREIERLSKAVIPSPDMSQESEVVDCEDSAALKREVIALQLQASADKETINALRLESEARRAKIEEQNNYIGTPGTEDVEGTGLLGEGEALAAQLVILKESNSAQALEIGKEPEVLALSGRLVGGSGLKGALAEQAIRIQTLEDANRDLRARRVTVKGVLRKSTVSVFSGVVNLPLKFLSIPEWILGGVNNVTSLFLVR